MEAPLNSFSPRDGEKYLDLNDTLIHPCLKIVQADGLDLDNDTAEDLIYYPFYTISSQCDMTLGD